MHQFKRAFLAAIAAALAACGGGEPDKPPTLKALAIQQQADATALAQASPCAADNQCAHVTFFEPIYSCSQGTYVPYLKTSRTAGWLVEAAAAQRATALSARALEAPPNFGCTLSVDIVNSVCVQSTCTIKLGGPSFPVEVPG